MDGRARLRSDGVAFSDFGGEIVILDLRASVYLSAKDVAAVVVQKLVTGASMDELVMEVLEKFEVPEDQARADIAQFVGDLDRRDLLERVDG